MSEKKIVVQSSYSLGTMLFLIFLVLKLTGNIDWSWWYVTMPLWVGVAAIGTVVLITGFFYVPYWLIKERRRANLRAAKRKKP